MVSLNWTLSVLVHSSGINAVSFFFLYINPVAFPGWYYEVSKTRCLPTIEMCWFKSSGGWVRSQSSSKSPCLWGQEKNPCIQPGPQWRPAASSIPWLLDEPSNLTCIIWLSPVFVSFCLWFHVVFIYFRNFTSLSCHDIFLADYICRIFFFLK